MSAKKDDDGQDDDRFKTSASNAKVGLLGTNVYDRKAKGTEITVTLIRRAAGITDAAARKDPAGVAGKMFAAKSLNLSWKDIIEIDNLEVINGVQELRLQHNKIRKIQNLDFLRRLTLLSLAHNRITTVENLRMLSVLKCLDLSGNKISAVDPVELPPSLVILDLSANPISRDGGGKHREELAMSLPALKILDGQAVLPGERAGLMMGNSSAFSSMTFKATAKELEMADRIFEHFDANEDGFMDFDEARKFTRETEGPAAPLPGVTDWTTLCASFGADPTLGLSRLNIRELYLDVTIAEAMGSDLKRDYAVLFEGAALPVTVAPASVDTGAEAEARTAERLAVEAKVKRIRQQFETNVANFQQVSQGAIDRAKSRMRDQRQLQRERAHAREEEFQEEVLQAKERKKQELGPAQKLSEASAAK